MLLAPISESNEIKRGQTKCIKATRVCKNFY